MIARLGVVLLAVGCGARVHDEDVDAAATPDTGWAVDADEGDTPDPTQPCPKSPPIAGTACVPRSREGSYCSYGDGPLTETRDVWLCPGLTWTWTHASMGTAGSCPIDAPHDEDACSSFAHCRYGRTNCLCPFAGRAWICTELEEGCPDPPPNAGDRCTTEMHCSYGVVEHCGDCGLVGFDAVCADGRWDYLWWSGK